MNEVQQDLISLRSGIWGHDIDLQGLVQEGWISKEAADLYLKEDIGSDTQVVLNDNRISDADLGKGISAVV